MSFKTEGVMIPAFLAGNEKTLREFPAHGVGKMCPQRHDTGSFLRHPSGTWVFG